MTPAGSITQSTDHMNADQSVLEVVSVETDDAERTVGHRKVAPLIVDGRVPRRAARVVHTDSVGQPVPQQ